jgi:hypothetical protein
MVDWSATLAHAGHEGSNNNMGVEVDWRDMKQLVPVSATLATFTGALIKNISDLGIEHADFLCRQGQPNLFPSVPKQLKSMYDLMQAMHPKPASRSQPLQRRPHGNAHHHRRCIPESSSMTVGEGLTIRFRSPYLL